MQLSERAPEHGTDHSDDASLLRCCQQGDAQSFAPIVERYMKPAYFAALGLVGNHDDALDLSQEAFVRAYRAIGSFNLQQRFYTWFYRILRNLCLNHLRDHAQAKRLRLDPDPFHSEAFANTLAQADDPATLAQRNEEAAQLWKAMGTLKPEQREILHLRDIEACSYAEIAERLDIPPGTVMSRLFHARKALKLKIQDLLS